MTAQDLIRAADGRLALRVLSDADVATVHRAALDRLGEAAAVVPGSLASAPRSFVLAARAGDRDVTVGAGRRWLATGGNAERLRPLAGGDPVRATASDLEAACRLADALPEVAVVSGPPARVAGETPPGQLALCLAATAKHVQACALRTAAEAEAAVRMAHAVAGSPDEARRRPPLSMRAGVDGLDAALVFARAGLPVAVAVSPPASAKDAGETDAHAFAAALVRHHAGVLAACSAIQSAAPGAPFLYLADPVAAGLPAAGPEAVMFQIAATQLAAHTGLPALAAGTATTSHEPDWQACTQDALATLAATAAGADVTVGAGTLGGGVTFSLQQLVMDAEIYSWNAAVVEGIVVDDETIALETIREVDICGNYLGQRHTRRHMKEVWRPRLLDRGAWEAWLASGREGAYEKATALAQELLERHVVTPLDDDAGNTLARIVSEV